MCTAAVSGKLLSVIRAIRRVIIMCECCRLRQLEAPSGIVFAWTYERRFLKFSNTWDIFLQNSEIFSTLNEKEPSSKYL